jgi:hypothetical protein
MIYINPTNRGVGVELWGTHDDLNSLYDLIGKYWNDENKLNTKGFDNRDKLISSFSYEIRKAYEGARLTKKSGFYIDAECRYYGTQLSWVHILYSLTALKYNMGYTGSTKLDISMILQLDYWIEKSMRDFDEVGARSLVNFIDNGLYGANEYIYHYMRSTNADFIKLKGGKRAFRRLPELLKKGAFCSDEYHAYKSFLELEAKRLGCNINEMDINDEDVPYEKIKW